jgi:hypothetical protein
MSAIEGKYQWAMRSPRAKVAGEPGGKAGCGRLRGFYIFWKIFFKIVGLLEMI